MSAAKPLSYDEARDLANDDDPEVRRQLAARDDLEPEILYFLAEDHEPEVRRMVAANETAPRQTHTLLARDADPTVRFGLAEKLARIAPDLSDDERDKLRQSAHESLTLLAKDEITKVRQILSETLKDVSSAPPDIIKTLALDSELEVSGPVLEFSPVLSDQDLIEIISIGTAKGGLNAISRRQEVGEGLSDVIVGTNDVDAIADLLSNKTAQIREETLDDLIAQADNVELWHAPLVSRPKLPQGAATRLSQFVADTLLDKLASRNDLDTETLEAVKSMVHHRLSNKEADGAHTFDFITSEIPMGVAKTLKAAGRLDENVISKALQANDYPFVLAALIVNSGLDTELVKKILVSHSPKGVVALVWKAKLTAELATQVQQRMSGIAPGEILDAKKGNYALTTDEMNWQIDYFTTRVKS